MDFEAGVIVHGWLMYASFGLLFPVGIIYARLFQHARKIEASARTITNLFRVHVALQVLGVVAMTVGAVLSYKDFQFNFSHTHERLGLFLWILICLQTIASFFLRPSTMGAKRLVWYSMHWVVGTGVVILGFYNVYSGMDVWAIIFNSELNHLEIAFSVQVAMMVFVYLFIERWDTFLLQAKKPPQVLPFSASRTYPGLELQEKTLL